MRVLSEQSGNKLRILPVDMDKLSDEEFMKYILELRGNRGKTVRKATTKDGSATTKTKKITKVKTTGGIIEDDIDV